MRIGEVAERIGVPADTVRFYEREGWLPRPPRQDNGYREYAEVDVEHLRLLIDLRRLELPLVEAARLAAYCHSGHCADTSTELPRLIAGRRAELSDRIARLRALDARLADLERHIAEARPVRRSLTVLTGVTPCCDVAAAVAGITEDGCTCCSPAG